MPAGGYRQPAKPAMVSGPGSMSARTDGGPGAKNAATQAPMPMPDAAYGEQADFQAIQAGAPMPQASPAPPPSEMFAPTDRPQEPITEGAPIGPGANALTGVQDAMSADMPTLSKYLPALENMALNPDVPRSFQLFVKYLRANAG